MMKTKTTIAVAAALLFLCTIFVLHRTGAAQTDDGMNAGELWNEANRDYAREDFEAALAGYERILAMGLTAPELLYNTGNACFRLGQIGRARAFYERALNCGMRNDEDLSVNLAFVHSMLKDGESEEQRPWPARAANALSIEAWTWTGLVCWWSLFMLAALSILLRGKVTTGFRAAMAFAAVGTMLCVLALAHQKLRPEHFAVVSSKTAEVMHTPSYTGKVFFTLHEGAKLRLLQMDGNWAFVQYGKYGRGWIEAAGIEHI